MVKEWLSTIVAILSCLGVGVGSWVGYSNSVSSLQEQTATLTKRADINYEKFKTIDEEQDALKERVIRNESNVTYLSKGLADVSANLMQLTEEMKTLNTTLLKIVVRQEVQNEGKKDGEEGTD